MPHSLLSVLSLQLAVEQCRVVVVRGVRAQTELPLHETVLTALVSPSYGWSMQVYRTSETKYFSPQWSTYEIRAAKLSM